MNDVISDDVTIVYILMNTHVKFFWLSLSENVILVSKMLLFIFNWRTAAILIFERRDRNVYIRKS